MQRDYENPEETHNTSEYPPQVDTKVVERYVKVVVACCKLTAGVFVHKAE